MAKVRLKEIDGLRGIAAVVVLIYHYLFVYDNIYGHSFFVPEFIRYGQYGVHLFFMISGFVIFWTVSHSKRALDFFWSRFSRLYPVYWASVLLTFTIVSIAGLAGREVGLTAFIVNLTMLHQYFLVPNVDGVYWTLTLELAFYFWMLIFMRFKLLKHIEIILLLWVVAAGLASYRKLGLDVPLLLNRIFILEYIELFAIGICLYKIKISAQQLTTYTILFFSVLSLFSKYPSGLAFGLILVAGLLYFASTGRAKFLSFSPFVHLGTVSYSLYLTHQNIGYVLLNYLKSVSISPFASISITIAVAMLVATLLTRFVERPSLRKLRELYKTYSKVS